MAKGGEEEMPHLRIYGIPLAATQECLEELTDALQETLANIQSLEIEKENVFIFYPSDRMAKGLGEEIICDAILFKTPKRTRGVRKYFSEKITETIQKFFPKAMVKCMAFPFDRDLGYSTKNPQK